MTARSFEDSAGTVWEVFEVQRASEAPRGVSPGLEKGWLSFVSDGEKRRLAPFPATWETSTEGELERLCRTARIANPARFSGTERRALPRDVSAVLVRPREPEVNVLVEDDPEGAIVREAIRSFAADARAHDVPAIEALVRLKSLLSARFTGPDMDAPTQAAATDMRRVRKWFVESYYFERQ